MIRKFYVLAAALALASCGDPGGLGSAGTIPTPSTVASHTTADEQAMLRGEQLYKAARTIGELLVDAGVAKGTNLVRLQKLDKDLYAALTTARSAYAAFNSDSLKSSVDNIAGLVDQVRALSGASK